MLTRTETAGTRPKAEALVQIKNVLSRQGGGIIASAIDLSSPATPLRIKVAYDRNPVPPGESEFWHVEGEEEWHPEYGHQIVVSALWPINPDDPRIRELGNALRERVIVNYLASSKTFRGLGIGAVKAKGLWDQFQHELCDLLDNGDVDRLAQVIHRDRAEALVARWKERHLETATISRLQRWNIDPGDAYKIIRVWGPETVAKLEADPFRLCPFLKGIQGWNLMERARRSVGMLDGDPRRAVGAMEHVLYARHDKGHTRTDRDELIRLLRRRLGNSIDPDKVIEIALRAGKVIGNDRDGYQHCGVEWLERTLAARMHAITAGESPRQMSLMPSVVRDERRIEELLAEHERTTLGFSYTEEQIRAVKMGLREGLSLVCGGPGVGKTAMLSGIQHVAKANGIPVFMTALAGRAAQRIRQATRNNDASTIESLIHKVRDGRLRIPENALVINDESSMLDLSTSVRLLRALPPGARLLLVGDPHQLAPISFGLVFHVLAATLPARQMTELTQVHRQAAATGIPQAAKAVRDGVVPDLPPYDPARPGVYFVPCGWTDTLEALQQVHGDLGGDPEQIQMISPTKNGIGGVNMLNYWFQRCRGEGRAALEGQNYCYAAGDPVIHLVNDYVQELFNGSMGIVQGVSVGEGGRELDIRWDDGRSLSLHEQRVKDISLAYSVTCHKVQGSQFPGVIIPVRKSILLDRTMIYTAMTRGVSQVVFVGDWQAFCRAVRSDPRANNRKIGFARYFG